MARTNRRRRGMDLSGAPCLITGASSGIGRATAVAAARQGARLVLQGRDEQRLAEVASQCAAVAVVADLREPRAVLRLFQEARDAHGRLDVVINCAGAGWAGDFLEMDADVARDLLNLNLYAPTVLARQALPDMVQQGRGSIVFLSSIAGYLGVREEAVYSASKAGIAALAESLRGEVGAHGIGISVIVPGAIDTPFFERRGRDYDRKRPRPVEAERVADAILEAVRTGRAETIIPGWLGLAVRVKGSAPGLYRRLADRFS